MAFRDFDTSQAFSRVRLIWHAREEAHRALGSRALKFTVVILPTAMKWTVAPLKD